ncbi:MAG: NmrA family NAD(P)-binding protein [Anaerolineae bacterium]|nr:NmrA family NAD(P)-binding protein [Anaerolineae bacterium]
MKIFVTGATGTIGRQIVGQLIQSGHQVRALTRNPANANLPDGVEVVTGDLTNPASFASALEGVDGLHLIKFGGNNYADLETGREIIALAEKAGIQRLTVLMGGTKGALEEAVESSSLAWTFLQPVEFMANVLEWAPSIRSDGSVSLPFGSRKSAIVHEADIAAVAATALTENGHGGKTYTITGGEVLTPREMVQMIGTALGRNIQFNELTPDEAKEQWLAAGHPQQIVDFLLWVYGNTPPMGYTVVPTVQQVTGRPPRTFAQWAAEHVDAFRIQGTASA